MSNELIIPPDIAPEQPVGITLIDDQTYPFKPQFGRGLAQFNSYGDPRWQLKMRFKGLRQKDQTRMHLVASESQGSYRTIMITPYTAIRGSWVAQAGAELFSNSDYSSLTGWSGSGGGALTVNDAVMKLTVSAVGGVPQFFQNVNLPTAYAPYVIRTLNIDGPQTAGLSIGPFIGDNVGTAANGYSTDRGYKLASLVALAAGTANQYPAVLSSNSGYTAGAYIQNLFTSISRCFLADGGGNNLLQSDTLDNASWTKTRTSISANASTAPDGTATADRLIEDGTASNTHIVIQNGARTNVAADICGYGYFSRAVGTRNVNIAVGNDTSNYSSCTFDLGAGTAGGTSNTGTATNGRAFIVSVGNGWYFCCVVSRNVAATTLFIQVAMHNGTNTTYNGDSTSAVAIWRLGATPSAVPTRGAQTVASTSAATSQAGSGIYVKGLPASQSGLLLPGDFVEIDGQLKRVTASLDSDAAGLGYLQVRPSIVRPVADNTPIIVTKPLGRFKFSENIDYDSMFGMNSDYDLTLEEVYE